jgi:hypothetical protein
MQAGSGGEKVVSDQLSVFSKSRKEICLWGAQQVSFETQWWSGGIVYGSEGGTNPESNSGRCRNVYLGVPTKFHFPQVKDSCTGRK